VKKQGASGKKKKKSKAAKQKNPLTMTTASLYEQLKAEIQERFQYEMKERAAVATIIQNVPTLRSICQKVGIQVEAKDYDFTLPTPFTADDILKLYPVVKHTDPEVSRTSLFLLILLFNVVIQYCYSMFLFNVAIQYCYSMLLFDIVLHLIIFYVDNIECLY
jgi:hypothetical protein